MAARLHHQDFAPRITPVDANERKHEVSSASRRKCLLKAADLEKSILLAPLSYYILLLLLLMTTEARCRFKKESLLLHATAAVELKMSF